MDVKEFCEIKDYKLGVKWSENYIELAKAMEEYHQMKLQEMKSMGLLTENLPVQKTLTAN